MRVAVNHTGDQGVTVDSVVNLNMHNVGVWVSSLRVLEVGKELQLLSSHDFVEPHPRVEQVAIVVFLRRDGHVVAVSANTRCSDLFVLIQAQVYARVAFGDLVLVEHPHVNPDFAQDRQYDEPVKYCHHFSDSALDFELYEPSFWAAD